MKRNQFLNSFFALPFVLPLLGGKKKEGKVKWGTNMYKDYTLQKSLVQTKPFNAETITQAIAAEIMSLVAWNHLNEERFANSFKITQEYRYVKDRRPNGATYTWSPAEGFEREDYGLTIFSPTTCQQVRIWTDGDWKCRLDRDELAKTSPSEYEHIVRNIKTGKERVERFTDSGNGLNQVKMIELYLKLGFYQYK